jgi:hypothetical protein
MQYCGIVPAGASFQLCALQETPTVEPPERLQATFYDPGVGADVAAAVQGLGEIAVALAVPMSATAAGERTRLCDDLLTHAGVAPAPFSEQAAEIWDRLSDQLKPFEPDGEPPQGDVDGSAASRSVFETNVEAIFCALQERRMPAKRHPLGIQRRVAQLVDRRVIDAGGDLWHRRLEELEAAAVALCAHRFAIGRARWVGDPGEGVIVLPGSGELRPFSTEGVLPPVARVPLPRAPGVDDGDRSPRSGVGKRLRRAFDRSQ